MSQQIKSQVISRRKALFLGGLAISIAVPATVLTLSDAEAQQPGEQTPKKKKKKKTTPSAGSPSEKPKAE